MGKSVPVENMKELIEISRKYGSDQDYVLAGGGNSSWKSDDLMVVKASGTELGSIDADGFVILDMDKLRTIRTTKYPDNREEREEQALSDLMSARLPGQTGRPSVESLLHALIPAKYVMHTHPAIVNGLTCSKGGSEKAYELFPDSCLWIPLVDPGYILAKTVDEGLTKWTAEHKGELPDYIFLANHGVFVWGETTLEIEEKYKGLFDVLKNEAEDFLPVETDSSISFSEELLEKTGALAGEKGEAVFTTGKEIRERLSTQEGLAPLLRSLSPDHIVYMGHLPLVVDKSDDNEIFDAIERDYALFTEKWGKEPKSVLVSGKGFISLGSSKKGAATARQLMLDALRVIRISDYFGGPEFMPAEKVQFINNWEVEKYRARLSENG